MPPPYLSYSGRGGSHRGLVREGRGGRGRGGRTAYARGGTPRKACPGRGNPARPRTIARKNQWVRRPRSTEQSVAGFGERAVSGREEGGDPVATHEQIRVDRTAPNTGAIARESSRGVPSDRGTAAIPAHSHAIMKKRGQHQLVLLSSTNARPSALGPISGDSELGKHDRQLLSASSTQSQTLTRTGKHKLVSVAIAAAEKRQKASMDRPSRDHRCNGFRGPNPGKPPDGAYRPASKRVRLSTGPSERNDIGECSGTARHDGPAAGEKECEGMPARPERLPARQAAPSARGADKTDSEPNEKLTDFAYKETSRVRQRTIVPSQHLRWSKNQKNEASPSQTPGANERPAPTASNFARKKNMGLVRVRPDQRTPICPTFWKGVECSDPYCRKRHDIPKECAMPVCSFFQRHGQCLRGEDCVFRHVRVNPRAVPCPAFALLGFCEDEHCKMRHVRAPKATNGTGVCAIADATRNDARETPRPRSGTTPSNVYYRRKPNCGKSETLRNHRRA